MKKNIGLLFFLFFSIVFICCSPQPNKNKSDEEKTAIDINQEKQEVSQVLDNLAAATESGNFKVIEEIWLHSDDVLLVGTESDEKLLGWDEISSAIKKQFSTFEETLISITDQDIWLNDDATMAWFYEELNYNFVFEEKAMTFKGIRFTGIMKKENAKWHLMQQHLSIPAQLEMTEMK